VTSHYAVDARVEDERLALEGLVRLDLREEDQVVARIDRWSPDGGQIVLVGSSWAPLTWLSVPEQIYVMRSNGTGLRQLTYGFIRFHRDPSWSRDGRWILFARCPVPLAASRDVSELVLLKPGGSDQRTIARLPGTDCVRMITWSPDGRKILYLNERTGVEVMNLDGSARRRGRVLVG
jgi:Tol biopolymer transport system component